MSRTARKAATRPTPAGRGDVKATANRRLIRRRARQASLLSLTGLAILAVGLVLNLRGIPGPALAALALGSIMSWTGIGLADKWLKPPRGDLALQRGLRGVGRGFALYHWVLPAEHVLVTPWGITVLVALGVDGRVSIAPGRWRESRAFYKKLLTIGRRPLGRPPALARIEMEAVRALLSERAPALAHVPVDALAVFTNPAVQVSGADPELAAVRADDLRQWAAAARAAALNHAARRELEKVLDAAAAETLESQGGGRAGVA
jgi:hypothetical protein